MSRRTRLLLKENNRLEQEIQREENRAVLTDLIVYIRSANISPYQQEQVRRDLWQMIADGERRGETAQDILGDDYRAFCDQVLAEIPRLDRKTYLLSLVRDVLLAADVLLGIWLVFQCLEQFLLETTLPYLTVTAGNLIGAVLILAGAFFLFHTISRNTFQISRISGKRVFFRLFLLLFVLLLLCMWVNVGMSAPLFSLHVGVAVVGVFVVFVVYKLLDEKLD